MKILAFAGSNSKNSINKQLVEHVMGMMPEYQYDLIDLNDFEMPIYSPEREEKGYPEQAHKFLAHIAEADAILVSLAEYNGSYSTAFKNIFDWTSRISREVFGQKPMLVMATSPGATGAQFVLGAAKASFPHFGGKVVETYSLPSFQDNFSHAGGVIDSDLKSELENKVAAFKKALS